jgi:hypothetical protein
MKLVSDLVAIGKAAASIDCAAVVAHESLVRSGAATSQKLQALVAPNGTLVS